MSVYYFINSFILMVNFKMILFYHQMMTGFLKESHCLKILFSMIKQSHVHMYVIHNHSFCYTVCTHYLYVLCISFPKLISLIADYTPYYNISYPHFIIMKSNQTLNFMYIMNISSHQTTAKVHVKQQFGM